MSWSSGISSAPWAPNSSWPLPLVAGNNVNINGWVVSGTGGGGGGGGGGGTTQPVEGFSIYLVDKWSYVDPGAGEYIPIDAPFSASLNTGIFPNEPPSAYFDNTSAGLDLSTGKYTAPFAGIYAFAYGANTSSESCRLTVNGTMPSLDIPSPGQGGLENGFLNLEVGDVVQLWATQDLPSESNSGNPDNKPTISWQMVYLSGIPGVPGPAGPAGPSGTTVLAEEFSITKSGTWINPGSVGEPVPVPGWTDVLDPIVHPLTRPGQLYVNLNYGTLDMVAGTFTAGKAGVYSYYMHIVSENETFSSQTWAGLSVNYVDMADPGLLQTIIPTSRTGVCVPNTSKPLMVDCGQVYLEVGDVVRVVSSFDVYDYGSEIFPVDVDSYKLQLWQMAYISSVPGPAGSTGPAGPAGPAGPPGSSTTTLSSAGGTSLVTDGVGPDLTIRGLSAGSGISITSNPTTLSISAPGAATTTLSSAGGTVSLVNDGTGPSLAVKGLTPGAGILMVNSGNSVTIQNTGVTSVESISPLVVASPNPIIATGTLSHRAASFNAWLAGDEDIPVAWSRITSWSTSVSPPDTWQSILIPAGGILLAIYPGVYFCSARIVSPVDLVFAVLQKNTTPYAVSVKTSVGTYSINEINCFIYLAQGDTVRIVMSSDVLVTAVETPALPEVLYGRATRWSMAYMGTL